MSRVAETQWGLMISVFCLSHVPALLDLKIPYEGRNLLLIAFLVLVVQSSDVLQYVWGKLLGRHKVARSSPRRRRSKDSSAVSRAQPCSGRFSGDHAIFTVAGRRHRADDQSDGILRRPVMSAIKRDRGVKDWGRLIEGHGGVLDRLDSGNSAAPVYFHTIRYFWTV